MHFQDDPFHQPTPLPGFPLPDSRTKVAREAGRLHADAVDAYHRLEQLDAGFADAQVGLRMAHEALDAALARGGAAGVRDPAEESLTRAVESAKIAADPDNHVQRMRAAITAQQQAVAAYRAHCLKHSLELLEELRAEAVKARDQLVESIEATAPARIRRGEVAARVEALVSTWATSPDLRRAWATPGSEWEPPFPDSETIDAWKRSRSPVVVPAREDEPVLAGTPGWRA